MVDVTDMSVQLDEFFSMTRDLVKQAGDSKVLFLEDSNYTNALVDYLSRYLLLLVIQNRKVVHQSESRLQGIMAWST